MDCKLRNIKSFSISPDARTPTNQSHTPHAPRTPLLFAYTGVPYRPMKDQKTSLRCCKLQCVRVSSNNVTSINLYLLHAHNILPSPAQDRPGMCRACTSSTVIFNPRPSHYS